MVRGRALCRGPFWLGLAVLRGAGEGAPAPPRRVPPGKELSRAACSSPAWAWLPCLWGSSTVACAALQLVWGLNDSAQWEGSLLVERGRGPNLIQGADWRGGGRGRGLFLPSARRGALLPEGRAPGRRGNTRPSAVAGGKPQQVRDLPSFLSVSCCASQHSVESSGAPRPPRLQGGVIASGSWGNWGVP